jgi:hypothetical protein
MRKLDCKLELGFVFVLMDILEKRRPDYEL